MTLSTKLLISLLIIILLFLQYKLWFEKHSLIETWQIEKQITIQKTENAKSASRNSLLQAEVNDLKHGYTAIEEVARDELGMIKKDEVFYQFVKPHINK